MNGRAARLIRSNGHFKTSDPALAELRVALFGDRFRGGFGRSDPAYMPLFPHEAAAYLMSRGQQRWDRHASAAELEQFIESAPDPSKVRPDDGSEARYDDAARCAAKMVLSRLRAVSEERGLTTTFWQAMESAYPALRRLQLSTIQRDWARSAVLRIIDAYRYDGVE